MVLVSVAREDHTNNDCFMCAILSHGDLGVVYGTDGIIQLDILVNPFKGRQCPTLAGKAKVFILQVRSRFSIIMRSVDMVSI